MDEATFIPHEEAKKIVSEVVEMEHPTEDGKRIFNVYNHAGKAICWFDADEVEAELDSYLNNASLANLGEVRIVHGIGGGTVRSIVREFLASHPLVRTFRNGGQKEGGDGATIVQL